MTRPSGRRTRAGLTAYRLTHNPDTSLKFAMLAGGLTLLSLIALALAHLAESWISHRPEHDFSYTLKRAVKVATSGVNAERREAALLMSERLGMTSLADGTLDAMRITRQVTEEPLQACPAGSYGPGGTVNLTALAAVAVVRVAVEKVDRQLTTMLSPVELAGLHAGLAALATIKERLR